MDKDRSGEDHQGPGPEPVTDNSGETTARAGAPGLDPQQEERPEPETDASGRMTARAGGEDLEGQG